MSHFHALHRHALTGRTRTSALAVGALALGMLALPAQAAHAAPASTSSAAAVAHAQAAWPAHDAGAKHSWIVTFAPGSDATALAAVARAKGWQVDAVLSHALQGMTAHLTAAEHAALAADPAVARLEADQSTRTTSSQTTTDGQWGLDVTDQRGGAPDGSYSWSATGAGVTAYIVDTGIDANNNDFGDRVRAGHDAVHDGNGTSDCYGHGTHMAGLVGGQQFGVAKDVTLVPVRVQGCGYESSTARYLAGIDWMVGDHQSSGTPAVANMSFDEDISTTLEDAVRQAMAAGIVVVAAGGNIGEGHGDDNCQVSPGRIATNSALVTVGGVQEDIDNTPTWYTGGDPGSCLTLLAPGYNIRSDIPGDGNQLMSGTSQATGLTTGAAALLLQADPSASPAQVKQQLVSRATTGAVSGLPAGVPNRLLYAYTTASAPAPTTTAPAPVATQPAPAPSSSAPAAPAPAPATSAAAPSAAPAKVATVRAPKLGGTARVGRRLTTDGGVFSPAPSTRHYSWYRVVGTRWTRVGTASSYDVAAADVNARIAVCVQASVPGRTTGMACSAQSWPIAKGLLASRVPTVSGTPRVGQLLVGRAGAWSPSPVQLRYQWYKVNGRGQQFQLAGATASSYRPTSHDAGYLVRLVVTGSKTAYYSQAVSSATTSAVRR